MFIADVFALPWWFHIQYKHCYCLFTFWFFNFFFLFFWKTINTFRNCAMLMSVCCKVHRYLVLEYIKRVTLAWFCLWCNGSWFTLLTLKAYILFFLFFNLDKKTELVYYHSSIHIADKRLKTSKIMRKGINTLQNRSGRRRWGWFSCNTIFNHKGITLLQDNFSNTDVMSKQQTLFKSFGFNLHRTKDSNNFFLIAAITLPWLSWTKTQSQPGVESEI